MKAPTRRAAFTLIELLVVIAIIAILIGLLAARRPEGARSRRPHPCGNNLKQIGLAVHNYAGANNGDLPPVNFYRVVNGSTGNAAAGSAHYAILPYLEQDNVFNLYTADRPDAGYGGAPGLQRRRRRERPAQEFRLPLRLDAAQRPGDRRQPGRQVGPLVLRLQHRPLRRQLRRGRLPQPPVPVQDRQHPRRVVQHGRPRRADRRLPRVVQLQQRLQRVRGVQRVGLAAHAPRPR